MGQRGIYQKKKMINMIELSRSHVEHEHDKLVGR
jgi:hypothetical protein